MKQKLYVSLNHTHFPKEDHLPDWARQDNQVKKDGQIEYNGVLQQ